MKAFIAILLFAMAIASINGQSSGLSKTKESENPISQPGNIAVDEVVVESSLYIKPKPNPQFRRNRRDISLDDLSGLFESKRRIKRQRQRQPSFGQSQAASNAAANQFTNNGFGSSNSAANAQAQAFNAKGPAGSFGASSAGTITQSNNINRFGGAQNAASASHGLNFNLPNGQSINFASTNSFANDGKGNKANSRGGAVAVNTV